MSESEDACHAVIMLPAPVFHMFLPEQGARSSGCLTQLLEAKLKPQPRFIRKGLGRHHLHLT